MSYAPIPAEPNHRHHTPSNAKDSLLPKKKSRAASRSQEPRGLNPPASSLGHSRHLGLNRNRHPSGQSLKPIAPVRQRAGKRQTSRQKALNDFPIIVHSHLCWDWVWQRPQQFVSRLSRRHKVLFVEMLAPDPALAAPLARFRSPAELPNLTLLTLQFPAWRWGDGAYVDAERRRLVQEFIAGPLAGQFENPVQWFYDPMTAPIFAGQMGEILTVYDCMDELSTFQGAPPEIVERERMLLARADVVFTGGRRLFEAKSRLHHNCHFYGCGVDWEHFGRARARETVVPPALAALSRPVLGYFGVVDERMDYALLARLAEANPKWSVVMVGPVLKVDQGALPRHPNLHWLGQHAYSDLPALVKAFDVCLMPFALNAATEFINPTKTLEYMATGRPIVGTPVPDVVRNFGSVVKIARHHEEFIAHCRQVLAEPDYSAIACGLDMARANTWDAIVARLEGHIGEALRGRRARRQADRSAAFRLKKASKTALRRRPPDGPAPALEGADSCLGRQC